MEKTSRSERLSAAREEFKESVESGAIPVEADRFICLRTKSSQAGFTVCNNVTIKDKTDGSKYTVSVSTAMSEKADFDTVLRLQAVIAKFLQGLHAEI